MFNDGLNLITIVLIGVSLSMDAFAVGVCLGLIKKKCSLKFSLKISTSFGLFQAFMLTLGWLIGINILNLIRDYDHWIAFIILLFIGSKMIYESFKDESEKKILNTEDLKTLLFLSIATSIDAFAVGISLSLLRTSILIPSISVGSITFFLSLISVYLGNFFGKYLKQGAEIFGGLILIIIGIKILLEHLF